MESTASFGYWIRRRRMALDLTQAALAARVGCAPVTIRKIERDERRPSRQMAIRLAACLAIPPQDHDRFIATGLGEWPVDTLSFSEEPMATATPFAPRLPVEIKQASLPETRFVGREQELSQLEAYLHKISTGDGQVIFIAGEAGRGKTALMDKFAQVAQETFPELIASRGNCTALAGAGVPYLPFRDILAGLCGEPETRRQDALRTTQQARSLWAFAPTVARTILADGPQLVDTLVPGRNLRHWGLSGHTSLPPENTWQAGTRGELQQGQIVEQVITVLHMLAQQRFLLLMVDDLQWADTASLDLLFHLGRRLASDRILIVCAYRPSEVAVGADGPGVQALSRIILEFRRLFGDIHIDLDHFDLDEARRLTDALLDREPNRLPDSFRVKLFWHTRGNPLFVLELLREMKVQGGLIQDKEGFWLETSTINWETLPIRVAAVIEQRLARLAEEEREILAVASVEGEHFTTKIVARIVGIDEMQLLRVLARNLEQRHRLVQEVAGMLAGERQLIRYQFVHVLYQHYLYETLGKGRRQRLHGYIAVQLESLHQANLEPVLAQLAHHYAAAGNGQKAVAYLVQVGNRARQLHALADALMAYEKASAELDRLQSDPTYDVTVARLQQVEMLLYRSLLLPAVGRSPAEQRTLLLEAQDLLVIYGQHPDYEKLKALLCFCRATYLSRIAAYGEAVSTALEGYKRYRRLSEPRMAASCLAEAGEANLRISRNRSARHQFRQALTLCESECEIEGESRCLSGLASAAVNLGDIEGALAYLDIALSLNQRHHDTLGQARVYYTLATAWTYYYHPANMRRYAREAMNLFQKIGHQGMVMRAAIYSVLALRMEGNLAEAERQCMQIHREAQSAQDSWLEGWTAQSLGRLALQNGRAAEAAKWLEQARCLRQRWGELQNQVSDLAWLGRLRLSQGRVKESVAYTTAAVEQLEASLDEYYVFETPDVFLCHAESLAAADREPETSGFIRRAYAALQQFAGQIRDPRVRENYLNYWISRRILEAWQHDKAHPLCLSKGSSENA
jgi:transcriptional regulator with XRE-family HTH domain/tetratricopeptide (TPR) repeat protein